MLQTTCCQLLPWCKAAFTYSQNYSPFCLIPLHSSIVPSLLFLTSLSFFFPMFFFVLLFRFPFFLSIYLFTHLLFVPFLAGSSSLSSSLLLLKIFRQFLSSHPIYTIPRLYVCIFLYLIFTLFPLSLSLSSLATSLLLRFPFFVCQIVIYMHPLTFSFLSKVY
jgi:hypothetical protein